MKNYNFEPMNRSLKANLSSEQVEDRIKQRNTTKQRHNQRNVKVFNRKAEDTES